MNDKVGPDLHKMDKQWGKLLEKAKNDPKGTQVISSEFVIEVDKVLKKVACGIINHHLDSDYRERLLANSQLLLIRNEFARD